MTPRQCSGFKIAVIGADGQLGSDLCKLISAPDLTPLTVKDLDVTDGRISRDVLKKISPDIIINTAAYHEVDKCEDNSALAFAVNSEGPKNLAEICKEIGAVLVHISTDYVFDGTKSSPYVESDKPNPLSVYAKSKLAGEQNVAAVLPEHFIIRSAGLYGTAGCLGKGGGNFVEGMIQRADSQPELRVVTDEVVSPTYTLDLAKNLYALVQTKKFGLYHMANTGGCSWYDFTVEIFRLLGRSIVINKAKAADFNLKANRPKYSVLKNEALAGIGLDQMRPWQEALKAYLSEKGFL